MLLLAWASSDWSSSHNIVHYRDGPPLAHTGGFGEPTCETCHFGAEINQKPGSLTVSGLPESYERDSTYAIRVTLKRGELRAAGFQLSIRDSTGRQLGELRTVSGGVNIQTDTGIQYAFQSQGGSVPLSSDSTTWSIGWTAPDRSAVNAIVSVVANAANGDDSQFGDAVYQGTESVPPAQ